MAFDLFDPMDWLELLFARRLIIPLAVGMAAAWGFYHFSGRDPASAAIAFGIGIAGLIVGAIWHIAGGDKPGSA